MKTAVSVPDPIFEKAERLARKMKKSRSQLYSDALSEYVARHTPDEITEKMNELCDELGATQDDFVAHAAQGTLRDVEW